MFGQKSYLLILISGCTLVILASSLAYNIYLAKMTEMYPSVVNTLGLVRGSIQKLVKAEMNQTPDDNLIQKIDAIFEEFHTNQVEMCNHNKNLELEVKELHVMWADIKSLIYAYRKNPTGINKNTLMAKSEDIWSKANSTVYLSQIISENAIRNNKFLFVLSSVNILIVAMVIVLLKRYVHDNLEYAASHDALTQLYNRAYFYSRLKSVLDKAYKNNGPITLVMYDIDHFKRINDTFGHDIGDYVLKELSAVVAGMVRKNDVLARVGGEEFALLLDGYTIHDGEIIANNIRKEVENHSFGKADRITISLGVAGYESIDNIDTIYKRADEALYLAKNNGRNRVEVKFLNN